jgi:1-phosphofructokinase
MNNKPVEVVTVTPNPAIDRTLTIPNFTASHVNRVEHQTSKAGGKGVNVASALADYGCTVAVTGFLGSDNASLFEALFSSKEIEDHFLRLSGETRTGIKIFDPSQEQTTDINFPGQRPTQAEVEMLFQLLQTMASENETAWFVLAGSLPQGVEPTLYRDLVSSLKAEDCRVLLDTSEEALRYALDAGPQIIKPNLHELETLVGQKLTTNQAVVEAARTLLSKGIELAVISMGADGALFVTGEEAITARPPSVKVLSTVGAGDAMVAGIIAAQLGALTLPETARLATAFSLAVLTRDEDHTQFRDSVEALLHEVTIEELDNH